MFRTGLSLVFFALSVGASLGASAQSLFPDVERANICKYWKTPGRLQVGIPTAYQSNPWQVRLTPEGSVWLYKYRQAIGAAQAPPTSDVSASLSGSRDQTLKEWEAWVQKRLAYDRWQAQQKADATNLTFQPARGGLPSRAAPQVRPTPQENTLALTAPEEPGALPPSLLAAVGEPPSLAAAVMPSQHTVVFDEGDRYTFVDHIPVPPAYAYYRFSQGVASGGTPLSDAERTELFNAAGLADTEKRVMMAVSRLEGSFDAINTYDTGFVSVGFIQFITSRDGKQSLASVLLREKTDAPQDFKRDFQHFGIDVGPDGAVATVDPETGAELSGPDAVQKIIDDKRLIAVFQRAGRTSRAFRVAQIAIAKQNYWPADDPIMITVNGKTLTGKVSDVLQSEAGMATLFDRKVNRGSINPFPDVVQKIMLTHNLTSLADVRPYERELVAACRYRTDFLRDANLQQPH